jgi:hypothetical protein
MSDSETTADLSDKNCTGDELEGDHSHMPKVVSQSNGIGGIKRPVNTEENIDEVNQNNYLIEINHRFLVFTFGE